MEALGEDYNAHQVWDKYIQFEKSRGEVLRVTNLYRRVLVLPLGESYRYYDE